MNHFRTTRLLAATLVLLFLNACQTVDPYAPARAAMNAAILTEKTGDYFIGRPGGLPLGIYARLGKKPKGTGGPGSLKGGRPVTSNLPRGFHTVFYVTRQPLYMAKFPVPKILDNTYRNTFGPNLRSALERELAYQARKA